MNIPYISAEEVRKNLSMEDAIQCTENVYKLKSQDKTVVWPTIFYEFDPGHADMDIKSGYLPELHISHIGKAAVLTAGAVVTQQKIFVFIQTNRIFRQSSQSRLTQVVRGV